MNNNYLSYFFFLLFRNNYYQNLFAACAAFTYELKRTAAQSLKIMDKIIIYY